MISDAELRRNTAMRNGLYLNFNIGFSFLFFVNCKYLKFVIALNSFN